MAMSARSFAMMLRGLHDAFANDPLELELDEVAALFRDCQIENFQREADEHGNPWVPRKGNYFHPPLRDTLRMYAAATVKNSPSAIEIITRRKIHLGIDGGDLRYPKYHQHGSPGGKIPKRRFFYLRREDRRRLHPAMRMAQHRVLRSMIRKHQDRVGNVR